MVATWDDSDEDSSDEEESQEVSNLVLMAIGDDDDLNEVSDPTYEELYDAFQDLHIELMKIGKKNVCLKKEMAKLKNENESLNARIVCLEVGNKTLHDEIALSNEKPSILHEHLKSHIDELKNENEMLKKKSNELNEIVLKFTNGQKMLDNMLNSQKCVFDKGGLGYKPNLKQKYYKNYFVKATSTNDHKIACHYCNQNGHMKLRCPVKRNAYYGVKCIWVPKGTVANSQGPKKLWVPKT